MFVFAPLWALTNSRQGREKLQMYRLVMNLQADVVGLQPDMSAHMASCQFSHCKPDTRENSRTLRVTSVA